MCEHQTAPIRPHRGQTSTHLTPAYVTSRILSAEAGQQQTSCKAADAHAVHTLYWRSAAIRAVYTKPHCDGQFKPNKRQPMAPHAPTDCPSRTRSVTSHAAQRRSKLQQASPCTMSAVKPRAPEQQVMSRTSAHLRLPSSPEARTKQTHVAKSNTRGRGSGYGHGSSTHAAPT